MAVERVPTTDLWPRPAPRRPAPPRLVALDSPPPVVPVPDPDALPAWDAANYESRKAAYDQFRATLRPLVLAVATAMSDRSPDSLARRSLPRGEQAFDDTLAAWEQFRAACEGRVR
jgi:hypothetical protein